MYGALSYLSYLWDLEFGEAKRWGDALWCGNESLGGGGDDFNGEEGFLLCNNGALKLYFKSYWVR